MVGLTAHQTLPTGPPILSLPRTRLIMITQHAGEVNGIHAMLFLGGKDCVGLTRKQGQPANGCPSGITFGNTRETVMLYLFSIPFLKGLQNCQSMVMEVSPKPVMSYS